MGVRHGNSELFLCEVTMYLKLEQYVTMYLKLEKYVTMYLKLEQYVTMLDHHILASALDCEGATFIFQQHNPPCNEARKVTIFFLFLALR